MATDRINNVDRKVGVSPIDQFENQLRLIEKTRIRVADANDRQIRKLIWTVGFIAAVLIIENLILSFVLWYSR